MISHFLEEVRLGRPTLHRASRRPVRGHGAGGGDGPGDHDRTNGRTGSHGAVSHVPHEPGEPILELSESPGGHSPRKQAWSSNAARSSGLQAWWGRDARNSEGDLWARLRTIRHGECAWSREQERHSSTADPSRTGIPERGPQGGRTRPGAFDRRQHDLFSPQTPRPLGMAESEAAARRRADWMAKLRVKALASPGDRRSVRGNQQKVAIARSAPSSARRSCFLDEPTRGIDLGSKAEIYRLIGELRAGESDRPGRVPICRNFSDLRLDRSA